MPAYQGENFCFTAANFHGFSKARSSTIFAGRGASLRNALAITCRRIFPGGGNFVKYFEEERQMMKLVQEADFVVVELTLYTDTHPADADALNQWREAIKSAAKVRRQYENRYGPLSLTSVPSEQAIEMGWRWNQAPWPWQR